MQTFFAKLLFDGENWLKNVQFVIVKGKIATLQENSTYLTGNVPLEIVIPGFINTHSHSFQRGIAGLGERATQGQDSFWSWREHMYQLVQKLTPDQFAVIAKWLYLEMLQSGYTTVGEFHYLHHQPNGSFYDDPLLLDKKLIESAQQVGMRLCHLPVLYQMGGINQLPKPEQKPFVYQRVEDFFTYHEALVKIMPADHQLGAAIHSLRAVPIEAVQAFSEYFKAQNIPLHIHISEQKKEVEEIYTYVLKTPIEWLFDQVDIQPNWTLIHATHATPIELELMAKSQCVVGLCPLTEANLGDGIFSLSQFQQLGGRYSIGSDSHIRIAPFEELRLMEYSQRLRDQQRICVKCSKSTSVGLVIAQQIYAGGRQSMQMPIGRLQPQNYADFIVLSEEHPATLHRNPESLWDELIFTGGRELIKDVYVGGKKVITDGRHKDYKNTLNELGKVYDSLS